MTLTRSSTLVWRGTDLPARIVCTWARAILGSCLLLLQCSNVEDIDEVWRDLRAWIGWKERLLGAEQRNFTQTWKKKGVLRWGAGGESDHAGSRRGVFAGEGLEAAVKKWMQATMLHSEGGSMISLAECYGEDWFQFPWQSGRDSGQCQIVIVERDYHFSMLPRPLVTVTGLDRARGGLGSWLQRNHAIETALRQAVVSLGLAETVQEVAVCYAVVNERVPGPGDRTAWVPQLAALPCEGALKQAQALRSMTVEHTTNALALPLAKLLAPRSTCRSTWWRISTCQVELHLEWCTHHLLVRRSRPRKPSAAAARHCRHRPTAPHCSRTRHLSTPRVVGCHRWCKANSCSESQ